MIKQGKKKSAVNDRIHLLEMTVIKLAETTSILKKQLDILSANQSKIIDAISPPKDKEE
tara:strand:+ start:623 stop:799 length:177 start_codon:yes stop_codon:yes gene_type:complete